MSAALLPEIVRPNGKPYRPRKIIAQFVYEDDEESGVVVLGTHDVSRAQKLADEFIAYAIDRGCCAMGPITGWWRDGFEVGRRCWVADDVGGRAGVFFQSIVQSAT